MSEQKKNKSKWLHIRVSEAEYNKVHGHFEKTTCRKLSQYARKKLLDNPIVTKTRNQSLDDFMTEMIKLRNELNSLGNNFNQAVRKLNTLATTEELRFWLVRYETDHQKFVQLTEQIKGKINQISELWLQS